ncbi:MAG: inosine/xanthosine triphosphatase [Gammaproteobacteria bacterium]|nr:inosine/xanthosine triphosphatase [Gammaproteobacteria bacterium]
MTETRKVVVASLNPVKIEAVRQAFACQFPETTIDLVPAAVESGVGEQPDGDAETRTGAVNRARAARAAYPDADYCVGLEGGVQRIDGELMAFAWMVVESADGRLGSARTVTLPLPPAVRELVDSGLELGDANDRVFSTLNSKQGGGAFGLLTKGLHTRESVYAEAMTIALVPFVHESFAVDARN